MCSIVFLHQMRPRLFIVRSSFLSALPPTYCSALLEIRSKRLLNLAMASVSSKNEPKLSLFSCGEKNEASKCHPLTKKLTHYVSFYSNK
mmetsp:Transcript_5467/g.10564  ORF Transcript_5467/g.10564 Transcript_5467/m.10564 type:complete len:89 (-) Transcript_5467:451-717(-)